VFYLNILTTLNETNVSSIIITPTPLTPFVVILNTYHATAAFLPLLQLPSRLLELLRKSLAHAKVRTDVPYLQLRLRARCSQREWIIW
jgi:hypothetical protein